MRIAILIILINCQAIFGQNISGIVINEKSKLPVEYVNIGIPGKGIGTVSDASGKYILSIDPQFNDDSLLFSSIGYLPFSIKISDLRDIYNKNIVLQEKVYELNGVTIRPQKRKLQTLGVTAQSKKFVAGFKDNLLGYECGVLMKVKKSAILKRININISSCTYDSIYYRLNIYKAQGKMDFENILSAPIYIHLPKDKVLDEIHVDLQSQNIVIDGDFLVTLEHVKDLGKGYLYFCVGLMDKTYYRKTSQGEWKTVSVGVSISVDADVEK
jgi:hypothetical protein